MKNLPFSQTALEVKDALMQYVTEKYSGDFEEIYYEPAIDATQNYVLCLKDVHGCVFNAFEDSVNGDHSDNYRACIIDEKMRNYLAECIDTSELNGTIGAMAIANIRLDENELESLSMQEYIERCGLYSLIFVYQFDGQKGSIEQNGQAILDIYRRLQSLNTDTIDFNIVVTSGEDADLHNALLNLRHKYSSSWYRYESVQEYISAANPKLNDVADLTKLVEVGSDA